MKTDPLEIAALDGRALGAVLTLPSEPRGAVLIAGANGVPHRFYAGTAAALAERGLAVLRFDYRGLATSRLTHPRHETARMRDWGGQDIAGALQWLQRRLPGVPLHLLGHSAGGWLTGFVANAGDLRSIVTVASQSGYWRLWPWPERALIATFWYGVVPLSVGLFGHLPGWVLGGGEPLPPGVARDWARWGRSATFIDADSSPGFRRFRGRLCAFAVAGDDLYAPQASVERFAGFYPFAESREVRVLAERGSDGRRPRHFSVFSKPFRPRLADQLAGFFVA